MGWGISALPPPYLLYLPTTLSLVLQRPHQNFQYWWSLIFVRSFGTKLEAKIKIKSSSDKESLKFSKLSGVKKALHSRSTLLE